MNAAEKAFLSAIKRGVSSLHDALTVVVDDTDFAEDELRHVTLMQSRRTGALTMLYAINTGVLQETKKHFVPIWTIRAEIVDEESVQLNTVYCWFEGKGKPWRESKKLAAQVQGWLTAADAE